MALILGALMLCAALAHAGALIHPAYWRYQNWMDHAQVPAPPDRITFRLGIACGGGTSCTVWAPDPPYAIWLAPGHEGKRAAFLHELGHVFDFSVMSPEDRLAFAAAAGRPGTAWHGGRPPTHELFASAYSACAMDAEMPDRVGQYGWMPTPAQHRAVCELITAAGIRTWRTLARPPFFTYA